MSGPDDVLFQKYSLGAVLENQRRAVAKAISALSDNQVLNSSVEVLVDRLARDFHIHTPVLLEEQRYMEKPKESEIEVYDPWDRARVRVPGYRILLRIPFEGDHELFYCHPSTFTLNPPRAQVEAGVLTLAREVRQIDAAELKASFENALATIKKWLEWVDAGVSAFNNALRGEAQQQVESRRAELSRAQDALAALGIPVRATEDAPRTYSAPMPRRSAPPSPSAASPKPLEPTLAQEHYEHILHVVHHVAKTMERAPASFASMGEEEIRDTLLAHLNGHYAGQATGETFNVSGKTDILVRRDDQNLFIAECKIWEGPAAFVQAIDQLCGYLGWRDRKAALFVFNRRKDVSLVLKKIREAVHSHASFRREFASPLGEGSFRFVLKQPADESADLLTSVLVFDLSPRRSVGTRSTR